MPASSKRVSAIYADISGITNVLDLDYLYRDASALYCAGEITESEYESVCKRIEDARARSRRAKHANINIDSSRATPRRIRARSPDYEKSRMRRRAIASRNMMPDKLSCRFTEGERAALNVVALSCQADIFGVCAKSIDEIGALAGVCRTTVQNAIHEARRLGIIKVTHRPQRGAKSLTNMIEIISKEWKSWLSLRLKSKAIGSNFFVPGASDLMSTTYDQSRKGGARSPPGTW
jgi:hypothetical protein